MNCTPSAVIALQAMSSLECTIASLFVLNVRRIRFDPYLHYTIGFCRHSEWYVGWLMLWYEAEDLLDCAVFSIVQTKYVQMVCVQVEGDTGFLHLVPSRAAE
jgi:hypothetical protein